jgi:branched-chain amino acid transport system permease protein
VSMISRSAGVLLLLALTRAVPFSLLAWAVRAQLASLRGFDVSLAAAALLSSEVFLALLGGGRRGVVAIVFSMIFAMALSSLLVATWSYTANRRFGGESSAGELVLVASLGLSALLTGTIGGLRGGGLRDIGESLSALSLGDSVFDEVVVVTLIVGVVTTALLVAFGRSKAGVGLGLLAQNREFAEELGIQFAKVAPLTGAIAGALAGAAGVCLGAVGGSSPEMGLTAFLYGAGGALVLPRVSPNTALAGGAAFAAVQVILEYCTSASTAQALLFTLILSLVLTRGSSRTARGER